MPVNSFSIKRVKLFACLISFFLFACASQKQRVDPIATALGQTPSTTFTIIPLLTTTSIPTSTPEPTLLPAKIQTPLPDVVFNIGSWGAFPLYECRENALPGQILISNFPYTIAKVLVSDTRSSSYSPVWSPNGDWIAYVAVKNQQPKKTLQIDSEIWNYPKSDSMWIIRPDGSDKHQVSEDFSRQEVIAYHNHGPACDASGGILSVEGWSADGQWITFVDDPDNGSPTLNAVNILSGKSKTVASDIWASRWAPKSNRVALVVSQGKESLQIQIVTVESAFPQSSTFTLPAEISGYTFRAIEWANDETAIFVLVWNWNDYSSPEEIWRLEATNGTWNKVTQVQTHILGFDSNQSRIVVCDEKFLGFQDIATGQINGQINLPDSIDCSLINYLRDKGQNELISFASPHILSRDLWVSLTHGSKPEKVISLDDLKVPNDFRLSGITWHP